MSMTNKDGIIIISQGNGQTSCKVWLASSEWRHCSNEAKRETRGNLLGCRKFANPSQPLAAEVHDIVATSGRDIAA